MCLGHTQERGNSGEGRGRGLGKGSCSKINALRLETCSYPPQNELNILKFAYAKGKE